MKKQKMGLDSLKGKLSRAEMKNIMAGTTAYCIVGLSCSLYAGGQTYLGNCDAGFGGGSGDIWNVVVPPNMGIYSL